MNVKLDLDNAIFNSDIIGEFFYKDSVNVNLRKYGLFLRGHNGVDISFYETNHVGYELDDVSVLDIIKETWVGKSQRNNITLVSPNHDSLSVGGKIENITFMEFDFSKASNVTVEDLCNNIPNYFNIVIFNINDIHEFGGKSPELIFELVTQLNELVELDGFIKIYKRGDMFFIFQQ